MHKFSKNIHQFYANCPFFVHFRFFTSYRLKGLLQERKYINSVLRILNSLILIHGKIFSCESHIPFGSVSTFVENMQCNSNRLVDKHNQSTRYWQWSIKICTLAWNIQQLWCDYLSWIAVLAIIFYTFELLALKFDTISDFVHFVSFFVFIFFSHK